MSLKTKKKIPVKAKLHVGDQVIVIAGKDKGRRGDVLRVGNGKVMVSGVQMVKRHTKPNPQKNQQGGIVDKEAWLAISNVAILNHQTDKADKIGYKFIGQDNKKKVRCFRSTGELIDSKE